MENVRETITKIIFNEKPILSHLSLNTYASCLVQILKVINSLNIDDFYNYEKVIKNVNDNWTNNNTLKVKYASVIVFLKCMKDDPRKVKAIEKYNEMIEKLSQKINSVNKLNVKNEKQAENWTTPEEKEQLKDILYKLIPKKISTLQDLQHFRNYIIYIFYTECVQTRNDLALAKIIFKSNKELSDEYNYIILDKKNKTLEYKMYKYKTYKSYGVKTIELPKELYDVFLSYKTQVDKFNNNNYLLLDNKLKQLSPMMLGKIFSDLGDHIGKKLSTSLNRHEIVSSVIDMEKLKKLNNEMGHSLNESVAVYAKQ